MFPRAGGAGTRPARGCGRSSREALAALETATLEDVATSASAHPSAKAVLLGTTQVVGLVGALHADLLGDSRRQGASRGYTTGRREPRSPQRAAGGGYAELRQARREHPTWQPGSRRSPVRRARRTACRTTRRTVRRTSLPATPRLFDGPLAGASVLSLSRRTCPHSVDTAVDVDAREERRCR